MNDKKRILEVLTLISDEISVLESDQISKSKSGKLSLDSLSHTAAINLRFFHLELTELLQKELANEN